jgi:hypothetical protein
MRLAALSGAVLASLVKVSTGVLDGGGSRRALLAKLSLHRADGHSEEVLLCETSCERFGMKSLAQQFSSRRDIAEAFEKTDGHPTECCKICELAFKGAGTAALLEKEQDEAAAVQVDCGGRIE